MNCYIYYILQIEPFQQELGLWAVCDKLQFVRCRGFTHDLLSCHYLPVKDVNTLVRLHPGLCISVETARARHTTEQVQHFWFWQSININKHLLANKEKRGGHLTACFDEQNYDSYIHTLSKTELIADKVCLIYLL